MRVLLCLALLAASSARAGDAGDEAAIRRVIAALNQVPPPAGAFTADSDAPRMLERLRNRPTTYRHRPTVVISHDPWGEANIVLPPLVILANPGIAPRAVRLITPDVAIVDAVCAYTVETIPLLFVMKKEGDDWKIDSARILASRPDFLLQ
jgi:hypothetical protein